MDRKKRVGQACSVCKLSLILWLCFCVDAKLFAEASRIKDLINIKGNRTNELMGFGLVVGLNGTGDSPASVSTSKAMQSLLSRLGSEVQQDQLLTQSSAAVVVTADLPAFSRVGDRIDVKVSILGDAASLAGGTLLMTPMKAGDGNVYSVAQGPIVIGQADGVGARSLTVAHVPQGGQIEKDFTPGFIKDGVIELSLKQPDFTTNTRVTREINQHFKGFFASSKNPSLITIKIPDRYISNPVDFISEMETLKVKPDQKAVVVLNERTGTIVMGGDVKIAKVMISHDGLSLAVGGGNQQGKEESVVPIEGPTVSELVRSLNAMGVKPKDLVSILQSIYASGALKAELKYL